MEEEIKNVNRTVEITKEILESIKGLITELEETLMTKAPTLSDLIKVVPTDEDYEKAEKFLAIIARKTYEDFKFLIAKSPDDTKHAHFLQLVSVYHEMPFEHKELFQLCVRRNLDMKELRKRFAERVKQGLVVDIGDEIEVITDEDGEYATGMSGINSGLEESSITFNISFVSKESYEDFVENKKKEKEAVPISELGRVHAGEVSK